MAQAVTRRRRVDAPAPPSVSRYRDEDEDDIEEDVAPPRRRRAPALEEEELPRRRRAVEDEDDVVDVDEEPRARSRRAPAPDDDEEEDAPAPVAKNGLSGFAKYRKLREEHSDFPTRLKLTDDYVIVKFLDDEPFAAWGQHWVGNRSWTCLEDDCPLCGRTGENPRAMGAFNVVVITPGDRRGEAQSAVLQVLEAGPVLMGVLDKKAAAKTGPLTREYYAVQQSGEKGADGKRKKTNFEVTPVKERDLDVDWGIAPLTDPELESFEGRAYDEATYVRRTPRKELRELARSLTADDED